MTRSAALLLALGALLVLRRWRRDARRWAVAMAASDDDLDWLAEFRLPPRTYIEFAPTSRN